MARRTFIAGNWKMNLLPAQADSLAMELKAALAGQSAVDVAIAPPSISIPTVVNRLRHTGVQVAGQNLHPEVSGAHTGELSGEMLRAAGCTYTLVGHSERRKFYGDTDDLVGRKVRAALRSGLLPILCVGETLEQREANQLDAVLSQQLGKALGGLADDQVASITIAYEPVWAIGTGRTATPQQAQQAHAFIRSWLSAHHARFVSEQVRIQYGGSVKPGNAASLLSQPDVDGALVGGASLKADLFVGIIRAVTSAW